MPVKSPDIFANLAHKRILLGISGGIAAYKAPTLVRLLRKNQADVQVVTTRSASQFVTHTALQAVSGNPVRSDLWDPAAEAAMGHIELARWAQVLLIAPATADLISRLANGRADDLLTTLALASTAPLLLAPAMNHVMWNNPATRDNVSVLLARGATLLGPDDGDQACGEFGPGRMREPEALVQELAEFVGPSKRQSPQGLAGKRVVITAGPTQEAIDPIRYISNHSSGKQGYALAAAAHAAGAEVVLISGPVNLPTPIGTTRIDVTSATQMYDSAVDQARNCDVFIGVAAVADYRPAAPEAHKIKKESQSTPALTIELQENPDIIASVAQLPDAPVTVGFAAETQHTLENARSKCLRKGLDAIVVNDVSDASIGFNSEQNAATMIWHDGELALSKRSKDDLAQAIIAQITQLFADQLANAHPERVSKPR
jgi:phosphopantothenoylcysteine decarboxylase/phosphopantothenate--cysteine ligase